MPAESFLEVARGLLVDPAAKAAFVADPAGYLGERGFADLTAEDVADATGFVVDTLPPDAALTVGALDPEAGDGDLLTRLAELEPLPPEALEALPSGTADDDLTDLDEGANQLGDPAFRAVEAEVPDPGFGVGSSLDDVDDLAAPELHDGDLPVGFELPFDETGVIDDAIEVIDPEAPAPDGPDDHLPGHEAAAEDEVDAHHPPHPADGHHLEG